MHVSSTSELGFSDALDMRVHVSRWGGHAAPYLTLRRLLLMMLDGMFHLFQVLDTWPPFFGRLSLAYIPVTHVGLVFQMFLVEKEYI